MESKNELIAKFMGGYLDEETRSWQNLPQKVKHYSLFTHELKYDTSWDWLMPVVEKISEYRLAYPEQTARVCDLKIVVDRQVLYWRVVEFIEWYNTLPSPPTEQQD